MKILETVIACGTVLAILGLHWAASAETDGYDRPTGYSHTVRWESPNSSAKGLMFFRSSAQGLVRRVLIETPTGRHLVLTKALLVREGIDREELRDEQSGWHAELAKRLDFRATSLGDYFAKVFDWRVPGEGKEMELALRTSTGFSFSATIPIQSQPGPEHASFAALLKAEKEDASSLNLPEGFEEELAFLEAAFERQGSDARGIIEILSIVEGLRVRDQGTSWRQVDGSDLRKPDLVDADEIAFASEFPSVNPIMPLPEGTIEALAEGRNPAHPPGR